MAGRSWATSIAIAIGVAAGVGAAQLGVGYGMGIISWDQTAGTGTTWVNSLAWVTWLAATSTVVGALVADRLSGIGTPAAGVESTGARLVTIAWRLVVSLSAGVGALITVPLVALPSRAPRPDNMAPYFTTGGYAVAGVIVGLVIAVGAVTARAIAANVIASTAWLWTLAVVAVADVVRAGGSVSGSAQLATWQFTDAVLIRGWINLPGSLLMLAIALVIGGLAAWPAGRRGDNRVGVAISGAAGPLLVAAAYFLAAPSLGDQRLSAFVMAPYAVLSGLAGSVIVSAIGPKGARTEARAARRAADEERTKRQASEFTDWTHALSQAELKSRAEEEQAGTAPPALPALPAPATPPAAPTSPAPSGALDSAKDLDDDAYAPARAYGTAKTDKNARAYAEDTVEPEPVTQSAPSPATGRATVKEPLWPTTAPGATAEPKPAPSKGRFRRGKGDPPSS